MSNRFLGRSAGGVFRLAVGVGLALEEGFEGVALLGLGLFPLWFVLARVLASFTSGVRPEEAEPGEVFFISSSRLFATLNAKIRPRDPIERIWMSMQHFHQNEPVSKS